MSPQPPCGPRSSVDEHEFNRRLGEACMGCGAACCKKGRLFLQRAEFVGMKARLSATRPDELAAFEARVEDHGDFLIYDQLSRCQFLEADNLCSLHTLGLKPVECFWWPYHVFVGPDQELEIGLSPSCCPAFRLHSASSVYLQHVARQTREIGTETLRAFRKVFPGNGESIRVGVLQSEDGGGEDGPGRNPILRSNNRVTRASNGSSA